MKYLEPTPSELVTIDRALDLGRRTLWMQGYRLRMIDGTNMLFEPPQEGITTYPVPVVTDKPGPPPPTAQLH